MFKPIFLLAVLACSTTAIAGEFSLTGGADYSSGNYGGDTTTSTLYVPVIGKYTTDRWMLKLTVPYLSVTSAGNVVRGMGAIRKAASTKTTTQSGLGDIVATAAYTFYDSPSLLLDVAGNIKFGTASASKGLGTGKNDYSAQLDGFYTVQRTTLLATLGHKIVGAPEGVEVSNINYATLGFSLKLDDQHTTGLLLDVAQSPTNLTPGARELTAFYSSKIRPDQKLQASLMKGLSDASADWGVGLMLTGYF